MNRPPKMSSLCSWLMVALISGTASPQAGSGSGAPTRARVSTSDTQNLSEAVRVLQKWYVPDTGLYQTTGWWNAANAITVLADYEGVSKSKEYDTTLANTFTAAQKKNPGFLNKYYDDEGWWALAWIDAYDVTRNRDYLSMAESIFSDMAASWDNTCGGGIWWSKDKNYKNAIANELFLSVASHLANRTSDALGLQYLLWSKKEWSWFQASGMINEDGLVNDGLRIPKDPTAGTACVNNGRTTWTYNQGVVLGGLTELSAKTHDSALLEIADKIATAAITRLTDKEGVLHDPCEPKCGADGVQFKGIFVRNLRLLEEGRAQKQYEDFIDKNAQAIREQAQGPEHEFSERWSGPFDSSNAAAQVSAIDALVASAAIHASGRSSAAGALKTLTGEDRFDLTVDATKQSGPPWGRGPFPGSRLPGHSANYPIRVDVESGGKLNQQGEALVDFIITNIGNEPIELPMSLGSNGHSAHESMTLFLTSDAFDYGYFEDGKPVLPFQVWNAVLGADSDNPGSSYSLAKGHSVRVMASTNIRMKPGSHSLTGHIQFGRNFGGRSEELGWADSIPLKTTFFTADSASPSAER